jgi:hypothetical protein
MTFAEFMQKWSTQDAPQLAELIRERDDARADARRLAASIPRDNATFEQEQALAAHDAFAWVKDDAEPAA